ncbi:MAG: cation:proton antiporter, partial [Anaerolineae bacterium]
MAQEFLNFILALVIIITAAKIGGYLSARLKQPSVLGELLAGLVLGPTVLDMLHVWPVFSADKHLGESITLLAELGVLLLMMLAGLELHLSELLKSGKVAALAGSLGVIVPLGLVWGIAALFGVASSEALFIGLTLAATSVSISAQTLMELKVLRSRVGLALLGAAVFDDILVILALSVSFILVGGAGLWFFRP